jgi:hypothetical protein
MGTNVMGEMEEDLNVMARILEKSVQQQVSSVPVKKLGLVFHSTGKERPLAVYLEEYGALFLLRVSVPLAPPRERPEMGKAEAPRGHTWEQTRQELYGGQGATAGSASPNEPAAEYDEQLLTGLKQHLLEALGNAAHIRHLKPDAYVTVALLGGSNESGGNAMGTTVPAGLPDPNGGVFGGAVATGGRSFRDGSFSLHTFGGGSGGGFGGGGGGGSGGGGFSFPVTSFGFPLTPRLGTTLTIRVKKGDVDAFAGGKLSLEELQKKATIQAYVGNSGVSGLMDFLNWPRFQNYEN